MARMYYIPIPTGVVGLVVVVLGSIGRLYLRWINPPAGGLEAASNIRICVGIVSLILLLVGGIISLEGAGENNGRRPGLVGILLAVIFLVLTFVV